jgi:hypothetical protein
MHRSKPPHSITSSALNKSDVGTSMPIALAVFRLMIVSNIVGCCTGRSAGLVPLRIDISRAQTPLGIKIEAERHQCAGCGIFAKGREKCGFLA